MTRRAIDPRIAAMLSSAPAVTLAVLEELGRAIGIDVSDAREGEPYLIPRVGVVVDVLTEEAAESVPFVMCVRWDQRHLPGSVQGNCADCGCAISWRPNSPRRPLKICAECAIKRTEPLHTQPGGTNLH